jgi:signal peptidase I
MNNYYLTGIFIAVIIIVGTYIYRNYGVGIVEGKSMAPTFNHKDLFIYKKHFVILPDEVYLIKQNDKIVIKRITDIKINPNHQLEVFYLGDNQNYSYDSRYFGFVNYKNVIGKVIKKWGK